MKITLLSIVLVTPLLLAGCAETEEEKVERLTRELTEAASKAAEARKEMSTEELIGKPVIIGAPPKPLKELTPEQQQAYSENKMKFVRENPELFDPEERKRFLPNI